MYRVEQKVKNSQDSPEEEKCCMQRHLSHQLPSYIEYQSIKLVQTDKCLREQATVPQTDPPVYGFMAEEKE